MRSCAWGRGCGGAVDSVFGHRCPFLASRPAVRVPGWDADASQSATRVAKPRRAVSVPFVTPGRAPLPRFAARPGVQGRVARSRYAVQTPLVRGRCDRDGGRPGGRLQLGGPIGHRRRDACGRGRRRRGRGAARTRGVLHAADHVEVVRRLRHRRGRVEPVARVREGHGPARLRRARRGHRTDRDLACAGDRGPAGFHPRQSRWPGCVRTEFGVDHRGHPNWPSGST